MLHITSSNHNLKYKDMFHQFVVDIYIKIDSERLLYIRVNQKHLRAEKYVHLRDAEINDGEVREMGQLVIIPSSFTGLPPYMHERTQDAMTYVRHYSRPDLFITFTCNPNWQEIKQELLSGQQPRDRHDLIARVFKQKVMKIMRS